MPALRQRLLDAQDQFFEALAGDSEEQLRAFEESWLELKDDLQFSFSCGQLDEETQRLAYSISVTISEMASSFAELEEVYNDLTGKLHADINRILNNQPAELDSTAQTLSRRDTSLAAAWLSQNLCNPYPSSDVRDSISRQSKWNRKDVDAWFTEARKRIGWSEIRRKFFHNKRAGAVEKATRFFRDQDTSMDPALMQALIDMEIRVHELYVKPFKINGLVNGKKPFSKVTFTAAPKRRRSQDDEDGFEEGHDPKRLKHDDFLKADTPVVQLPSPPASDLAPTETASKKTLPGDHAHEIYEEEFPVESPLSSASEMQACSNILSTHSKDAQQTALPLRPGPPYTISSPLSSYSFIATSSTNSQPQESILWSPDNRAASTHGTCNQSQLSVDVPGPVTCDQILTTQAVNLAVFQTTNTLHGPFVSDSSEKRTSSRPPAPLLAQNTETMSFSGILDDLSCNEQISAQPHYPLAYKTLPQAQIEAFQDPGLELNLDPFIDLDMITTTHSLGARADDEFFSDLFDQSLSNEGIEKAKKIAHLEMLKRQKDLIQERIHSLEKQISIS